MTVHTITVKHVIPISQTREYRLEDNLVEQVLRLYQTVTYYGSFAATAICLPPLHCRVANRLLPVYPGFVSSGEDTPNEFYYEILLQRNQLVVPSDRFNRYNFDSETVINHSPFNTYTEYETIPTGHFMEYMWWLDKLCQLNNWTDFEAFNYFTNNPNDYLPLTSETFWVPYGWDEENERWVLDPDNEYPKRRPDTFTTFDSSQREYTEYEILGRQWHVIDYWKQIRERLKYIFVTKLKYTEPWMCKLLNFAPDFISSTFQFLFASVLTTPPREAVKTYEHDIIDNRKPDSFWPKDVTKLGEHGKIALHDYASMLPSGRISNIVGSNLGRSTWSKAVSSYSDYTYRETATNTTGPWLGKINPQSGTFRFVHIKSPTLPITTWTRVAESDWVTCTREEFNDVYADMLSDLGFSIEVLPTNYPTDEGAIELDDRLYSKQILPSTPRFFGTERNSLFFNISDMPASFKPSGGDGNGFIWYETNPSAPILSAGYGIEIFTNKDFDISEGFAATKESFGVLWANEGNFSFGRYGFNSYINVSTTQVNVRKPLKYATFFDLGGRSLKTALGLQVKDSLGEVAVYPQRVAANPNYPDEHLFFGQLIDNIKIYVTGINGITLNPTAERETDVWTENNYTVGSPISRSLTDKRDFDLLNAVSANENLIATITPSVSTVDNVYIVEADFQPFIDLVETPFDLFSVFAIVTYSGSITEKTMYDMMRYSVLKYSSFYSVGPTTSDIGYGGVQQTVAFQRQKYGGSITFGTNQRPNTIEANRFSISIGPLQIDLRMPVVWIT